MKKTNKNELKLQLKINYLFKKIFSSDNIRITSFIIPYLDYTEVLSLSRTCKSFHTLIRDHKVMKSFIIKGKLSPENRFLFYITNLNLSGTQEMVKTELIEYKIEGNYYQKILVLANNLYTNDKKFKKICDEIGRDLHRTFYIEKFRTGNGRVMLKNILTAVGFVRPEIGYCQGMNFIAGALVNLIDNEEKCFWIFLSFIDNIEMNFLYLKNMPDYSIRVYQLNHYIKEYFPELSFHFKKNQINPDVFFSKWILTIFSNYLPFEVLYKVWDVFIFDKWKAIFKFSLMILNSMKDKLITMDLVTFSQYIKDNKDNSNLLNFDEFSKHYKDYKITNRQLNELREDFFIDQLKTKIEAADSEWETDQSDYVNNYKKELDEHLKYFKVLMDQLKDEIGKINIEYEQKSKKYEKKLKNVNELKMKIETQIEIKTGY